MPNKETKPCFEAELNRGWNWNKTVKGKAHCKDKKSLGRLQQIPTVTISPQPVDSS